MNSLLRHLQDDFQGYVLDMASEAAADAPAILSAIAERKGLPADRRLAIYHHAYRARLRQALAEAYGRTHAYVGDALFHELSASYVETHVSRFRNLRWYGERFPEFVAQALPEHPVVAELAAFEWTLGLSFDAADAPVLGVEALRAVGADEWESVGFDPQPSLHFLTLRWNAVDIWLALDKEHEEQVPPAAAQSGQPTQWIIWRKDLQPHFRSLSAHEARALQGLRQGQSFSGVCGIAAAAAGDGDDIASQIGGWLQSWLEEALLARVNRAAGSASSSAVSPSTP
ncbi:MAG TPA: DNA-binding domain-containing protein [Paucimonas sp.]|nr:DNA-binding domain-containing protein [Paucimonas sp.]